MNVYRVRILKESAKNKEKKNGFRNEGPPFVLSSKDFFSKNSLCLWFSKVDMFKADAIMEV